MGIQVSCCKGVKMSRMYEVNGKRVRTWNVFKGCLFNCVYCVQREQAKRQKHRCELCYRYKPHLHPKRLNEKFKAGETVFVAAAGDISFMLNKGEQIDLLNIIRKYSDTTFLLQTKDPRYYLKLLHWRSFPKNIVIGTTIETNRVIIGKQPYSHYSKAPYPDERFKCMGIYTNLRKYITIEPIMDFDLDVMVAWIKAIAPEFVYVGYLNPVGKAKKLQLLEPSLDKTIKLCKELEKFTEVRLKTLRKGWQEE